MNYYGTKELAQFLNRDIQETFDKVSTLLKENDLDPNLVMQVLVDYAQGEDYAENTVESISKRLAFIASMDKEKTIYETQEDAWIKFGTVHSQKQQYEIKKMEGRWFAKVKMTHSGQAGDDIAIQVNDNANNALNNLFE